MKKFITFVKELFKATTENQRLLDNIKRLEDKEILNKKNY